MIFSEKFCLRQKLLKKPDQFRFILLSTIVSAEICGLLLSQTAVAQSIPDAGALLRQNQRDTVVVPPPVTVRPIGSSVAPMSPQKIADDSLKFVVESFNFSGATLVPENELQEAIKSWLHREIHFSDLELASDALTETYRAHGWFVRVVIPEQDIDNGIVTFNFLEAKLGNVRVVTNGEHPRLQQQTLVNIVTARQKTGDYLNVGNLDRASNLLGEVPGVVTSLSLAPGKSIAVTDVVVSAEDKPLFSGVLQVDNQGARSTGINRLNASFNIDNPRGIGDQVAANTISTLGSEYGRISYTVPLFSDGMHIGTEFSDMKYHLIGSYAPLKANGTAQILGVFGTYPVVRLNDRSLSIVWTLEHKAYENYASDQQISDKTARELTVGLSSSMSTADGSFILLSGNATLGQLDLSKNLANEIIDLHGPHTEGTYGKVNFNVARLQRLPAKFSLWLSATGQIALKNLDSSEKISLGGMDGVSAYPNLEASGDNGILFTAELRKGLTSQLQGMLFYNYGAVIVNHNPNYPGATALDHYSLSGIGLGLNWSDAGKYSIKASVSRKLGTNPAANPFTGADSDGSIGHTRYWLSASVYF